MAKPRPPKQLEFVLNPERDAAYVHFENGGANPFDAHAATLHRRNAWWLADAALLSYWDAPVAITRFTAMGLRAELVDAGGTQASIAWSDTFLIVAFRGTESDQWSDIFDDVKFRQVGWDGGARQVHRGFKEALERIWPALAPMIDRLGQTRRVWFGGHSLGAAIATLAADRYPHTAGLCTIGSPRVGDLAFAAAFNARFAGRARRYVNDSDVVTHVPPPIFFAFRFKHVGERRQIAGNGAISPHAPPLAHFFTDLIGEPHHMLEVMEGLRAGTLTHAPKFILDHMPRGYAVDIWNDYEANGD
jgi:hypothetical protein